ncbi:MAG TPA: hypothetical protein PKG83_04490, partial [bacterium]|nr:hypothetical protein [bacterium]
TINYSSAFRKERASQWLRKALGVAGGLKKAPGSSLIISINELFEINMQYPSLKELLDKLKISSRVKGVFSTGTTATSLTPASDIDLIVVIDKNFEEIKSIFATIENRFADIYFFDIDFIN